MFVYTVLQMRDVLAYFYETVLWCGQWTYSTEEVTSMVSAHHHFDPYDQRCFHTEKPTGSSSQKVLEVRDLFSRGLHYVSLLGSPFGPFKL